MPKPRRSALITPTPSSEDPFSDWAGPVVKKKLKATSATVFERTRHEVERMMKSGEWNEALPRHFVALYAIRHEQVYGIAPGELTPAMRTKAAGMATRMLTQQFNSDPIEMADYFWWVWAREASNEKWRRANGRSGGRIGVGYMFTNKLVTDWRLDKARKGGHTRP